MFSIFTLLNNHNGVKYDSHILFLIVQLHNASLLITFNRFNLFSIININLYFNFEDKKCTKHVRFPSKPCITSS